MWQLGRLVLEEPLRYRISKPSWAPCLEAVPLRSDISQVRSIQEFLEAIHATNRAILPHSSLPMTEIKKAAGLPSAQKLYQVLFVYQESLSSRGLRNGSVKEVAHQDHLETQLLSRLSRRSAISVVE